MPRANRYFLPNHVWHITHRCHQKDFLLKFAEDRKRWIYWLFEAKKRYGLRVLNYMVTSNHIHLLVLDQGKGEVAKAMQLVAGRTAQEYNRRKGRRGAFWEDRYHATAVEAGSHLARCLVYIDLNMVRAGAVQHPVAWKECGYHELQSSRERYAIVDINALLGLLGYSRIDDFRVEHNGWIDAQLRHERHTRDASWTEGLAVGSEFFVADVKERLGMRARYRKIEDTHNGSILREPVQRYTRKTSLKQDTEIAE